MKLTLSPRQAEIHAALLAGERGKDIARRLKLSPKTVYEHAARAREKIVEGLRIAEEASKKLFNRESIG